MGVEPTTPEGSGFTVRRVCRFATCPYGAQSEIRTRICPFGRQLLRLVRLPGCAICAYGAQGGNRTRNVHRTPAPQTGVSTSSTTRAYWCTERDLNSHRLSASLQGSQPCVSTSSTIGTYIFHTSDGFEPTSQQQPSFAVSFLIRRRGAELWCALRDSNPGPSD